MDYNITEEAERLSDALGIDDDPGRNIVLTALMRAENAGRIKEVRENIKRVELVTGGK